MAKSKSDIPLGGAEQNMSREELAALPDISEGIENRLYAARRRLVRWRNFTSRSKPSVTRSRGCVGWCWRPFCRYRRRRIKPRRPICGCWG